MQQIQSIGQKNNQPLQNLGNQNQQSLQNTGNKNQQSLQNLGNQNFQQNQQLLVNQNSIDTNYATRAETVKQNGQVKTVNDVSNNDGNSVKRMSIEVRKNTVIGTVIKDHTGENNANTGEKIYKNNNGINMQNPDNIGQRLNVNADSDQHVNNNIDARETKLVDNGAFDVADLPKSQDNKMAGNANLIPADIFDKKGDSNGVEKGGGIPKHIHIIDGEVEKNFKNSDENIINDDRNFGQTQQRGDGSVNNAVFHVPSIENNEIPRQNVEPVEGNRAQQTVNNHATVDDDKPGSLKVVWDWSDFAVNFEQYVMPEQKIRRAPHATTGEPWPMPQYYVSKKDKVYKIDRASFRFNLSKIKCDIIEKAIERYKPYVLEDPVEDMYDNFQHAQSTLFEDPSIKYDTPLYLNAPVVPRVLIKIRKPCSKYPSAKSDETCKFDLNCLLVQKHFHFLSLLYLKCCFYKAS